MRISENTSEEIEREHGQIVDAVLSRDLDRSWALLKQHLSRTVAAVRERFG
jgi:DNA-binding GntR family transcriptional regulator